MYLILLFYISTPAAVSNSHLQPGGTLGCMNAPHAPALVKTVNIVNQGTQWQIMGDRCGPDMLLFWIILCVCCDEQHPGAQVSCKQQLSSPKRWAAELPIPANKTCTFFPPGYAVKFKLNLWSLCRNLRGKCNGASTFLQHTKLGRQDSI